MALIVVIGAAAGFYVYNIRTAPTANYRRAPTGNLASTCHDSGSIWSHVYNPSRLDVLSECITVSGKVENVRSEADGDYHVRLRLDPAYANLTNDANYIYQNGDLVVEIVCATTVTQSDAMAACENYSNSIPTPTVGEHVTVSGRYVLDTNHGWTEIHPAYSLTQS